MFKLVIVFIGLMNGVDTPAPVAMAEVQGTFQTMQECKDVGMEFAKKAVPMVNEKLGDKGKVVEAKPVCVPASDLPAKKDDGSI